MTEPTTAAGRATVEAFYQYTAVEDRDLVRDYILAIEAEARAAALDEARATVDALDWVTSDFLGLLQDGNMERLLRINDVLAAIEALREGADA